jgi:predicted GNAT family acetyltransferase
LSEVVNNESAQQFEVVVDGATAFLRYAKSHDGIHLLHTEVPPQLGGRGIGAILATAALDHAKDAGLKVTPICPFVKKYLERHSEYAPLLQR